MSEENISCATACADKEDKTDNINLIFDVYHHYEPALIS